MKNVKPEIYVVSRPALDWDKMEEFLLDQGGAEWQYRVETQHSPDGEDLVEFAGRLCYQSFDTGINPNISRVRTDSDDYLTNILKSAHGSVLEHANYTFVLRNVSRVLTHELIRHRAGTAYSQESGRYVRLDEIPMWFPDWVLADEKLHEYVTEMVERSEAFTDWVTTRYKLNDPATPFHEKKKVTSFIRRLQPGGLATNIVMTANIRAIRHMIAMRTAEGAEEEIRIVFHELAMLMQQECPALFSDFEEEGLTMTPSFPKV